MKLNGDKDLHFISLKYLLLFLNISCSFFNKFNIHLHAKRENKAKILFFLNAKCFLVSEYKI